MSDAPDLVEQLATAAADAVRARRAAIEAGAAGALRGITVELEVGHGGRVVDATSYLSWKNVNQDREEDGGMSEGRLRVTTEADRARLQAARARAEVCGACGRPLGADETVYLERFAVVRSHLWGPVGRECASPDLLGQAAGTEPELCAACGRGVYYGSGYRRRGQAICSNLCAGRASAAKQRARGRT